MHVSPTNVIRFPVLAPTAPRPAVASRDDAGSAADVVAFPAPPESAAFAGSVHAHGSLYAADRIVTRVAAALDEIPDL